MTVPKPYNVAANGDLPARSSTTGENDHHRQRRYRANGELSGDGQHISVRSGERIGKSGVPIRNYFEKGVSAGTRALFAKQDEMISYFETLFGPFPFDVYGALMLDTQTGGTLEAQTLSISAGTRSRPTRRSERSHHCPRTLASMVWRQCQPGRLAAISGSTRALRLTPRHSGSSIKKAVPGCNIGRATPITTSSIISSTLPENRLPTTYSTKASTIEAP